MRFAWPRTALGGTPSRDGPACPGPRKTHRVTPKLPSGDRATQPWTLGTRNPGRHEQPAPRASATAVSDVTDQPPAGRGAIRQVGGDTPGFATPALQLGDGVVDTRFRASDDHRASAVVDDVDRDLPTHAGTAAHNNDFLGRKMHIGCPFEEFALGHAVDRVRPPARSHRLRHRPRCRHASDKCPCTELVAPLHRRAWCM